MIAYPRSALDATEPSPAPVPGPGTVLKDEPAATVELVGNASGLLVRKTYRNLGSRLARSFWRKSRAAREYENLYRTRRAGIPVVEPVSWCETRRWGCVPESSVTTRYASATPSLRLVLRQNGIGAPGRARLVQAMGRLIAQLHAAGILWGTLTPRNFLLQGELTDCELLLCDMPEAMQLRASIHGQRSAGIDLYDAAMSPSRRRDFTTSERWRMILAYCGDDRRQARVLWRRLAGRSRSSHLLRKRLRVGVSRCLGALVRILPGTSHRDILAQGRE